MIRQLDKKEKEICKTQIKRMKDEIKHFDFLLRYNQLMVDEGCWWNYQEQLKTRKGAKKEIEEEIGINNEKIKILETQIKEGVEMKENKTPSGVG